MTSPAITVRGLKKSYGDHVAVRGIDLDVEEGQIFAFLGPNGAGKTTSVEIMEGFRDRSGGEVSVLGVDPAQAPLSWRERVGIVLQDSEVEGELSARESLQMQASYYRKPRPVDEVLELVGLSEQAAHRASKLSGGQQRRLDLGLALIGDPELIFLDEPTTGFDPSARRDAWQMIDNLRTLGRTVFLTTHYMDEADALADQLAIIAKGEIVASGTASDLSAMADATPRITWEGSTTDLDALPDQLRAVATSDAEQVSIATDDVVAVLHELTGWAGDRGDDLLGLSVVRPSLEDIYLQLAGEE